MNYMLKSLPSKYVFAGYSIRKSLTIVTSYENGKLVYDEFLFTYLDNYLSFYVLMDNGKYKNVDFNIEVPEATAEDLMSRHLARGRLKDEDEFKKYERDTIVGVFGLRNMEVLMKQVDNMNKESGAEEANLEALLDVKSQYMGMEIVGSINAFNRALKWEKGRITVPAIVVGPDDPYISLIGDEMDYYDFMSNKDSDTIVRELKTLAESVDSVGNLKK